MIKTGDKVRFKIMPDWVETLPKESRQIFQACLGKIFPVVEVDQNKMIVLDVSKHIDPMFGDFQNDIRLEPKYLLKK